MLSTLCIAGVGVLGGSVAAAARSRGVARRIVGLARPGESLEAACHAGLLDEWHEEAASALAGADFVLLARPVNAILDELPGLYPYLEPGAIVTDVGSTKERIVRRAEDTWPEGATAFVGSHPMTGSDRSGWENANGRLFERATTFVTVTQRTSMAAAARVGTFWRALGSRVSYSHPGRHDQLVALLSHVPHLVAVALVEQLGRSGEDPNVLRRLAGPGVRDTTRIARGNPELWEQIFRQNARTVAELLDAVGGRLHELATACREEDTEALRQVLSRARDLRNALE